MEFVVNEPGCERLIQDMDAGLREIKRLADEMQEADSMLRSALGEDYDAVGRSTRYVISQLGEADREMSGIIRDMREYMARVKRTRVILNG